MADVQPLNSATCNKLYDWIVSLTCLEAIGRLNRKYQDTHMRTARGNGGTES